MVKNPSGTFKTDISFGFTNCCTLFFIQIIIYNIITKLFYLSQIYLELDIGDGQLMMTSVVFADWPLKFVALNANFQEMIALQVKYILYYIILYYTIPNYLECSMNISHTKIIK